MIERWLAILYPEIVPEVEKHGLTKLQREWVRRCYSDENGVARCHFPVWKGDKWEYCWSDDSPQANHIIPQGYAHDYLYWSDTQINNPYNLIINCSNHHIGNGYNGSLDWRNEVVPVYHPDNVWARKNYHGTEKPTSYDILFSGRHQRVIRGETYWNTDWTEHMLDIARIIVDRYISNNPDDKWPIKHPHKNC